MNIFRRPAVHYGKTPRPETPYQKAQQIWDERIGSARMQARNWRAMAFGSLILSAGLSTSLVWQLGRGTVVPWVVQVDKMGQVQATAPAIADYKPTDPQIAWHLARFVELSIYGAKSAHPSMQPAAAFLRDVETMLRALIAGAVAPSKQKPVKSARPVRKTGVRK